MRRKEERSKQGQTNNKTKQHSTPKAVSFSRKNELPRVGIEPTTLCTLDRESALPRQHSWLGPNLASHSTPGMYNYVCLCACVYASVCMFHERFCQDSSHIRSWHPPSSSLPHLFNVCQKNDYSHDKINEPQLP